MTTINTMSAAKQVAASVDALTAAEKKAFLAELTTTLTTDIQASAEKEHKAKRIGVLKAARTKAVNDISTANKLGLIDGMLARAGLPELEVFVAAGDREVDNMLKTARRPLKIEERLDLKAALAAFQ
jgi:hypothetical protein